MDYNVLFIINNNKYSDSFDIEEDHSIFKTDQIKYKRYLSKRFLKSKVLKKYINLLSKKDLDYLAHLTIDDIQTLYLCQYIYYFKLININIPRQEINFIIQNSLYNNKLEDIHEKYINYKEQKDRD